MRIACLLPSQAVTRQDLEQPFLSISEQFEGDEVIYFCQPGMEAIFSESIDPIEVNPLEPESLEYFKHIVIIYAKTPFKIANNDQIRSDVVNCVQGIRILPGSFLYIISIDGMITYSVFDADGEFHFPEYGIVSERANWPYFKTHEFNRLAISKNPALSQFGQVYFPYGYLMRDLGCGPSNALGFRITVDLNALVGRSPDQIVIACFGGSACAGYSCRHNQMFSSRLESLLNSHSEQVKSGIKFSVLNFGMHGAVTLNEIINYIMFCAKIKPEIVISHNGYNDIFCGMTTDEYFISEFGITYSAQSATWSKTIFGSHHELSSHDSPNGGRGTFNDIMTVVRSYLLRLRQFKRMVLADGGRFIWGLQPQPFSKTALSEFEKQRIASIAPKKFSKVFEALPVAYDILSKKIRPDPDMLSVNFHQHFRQFGADQSHFSDQVHLLPAGDEEIARIYFETIRQSLLPTLVQERVIRNDV